MLVWLTFGLFVAATAQARSVVLDARDESHWRREVAKLRPTDSVIIDAQTFPLVREVGAGDYGRVFETVYEGKSVAIKLQSDPYSVKNNPDHQVQKQADQFQHLAAQNIPVPEIYLAPPNRPYLVMELIGKETWLAKIQSLESTDEKLAALEPLMDLLLKFEIARCMPKDRKNLAKNIVLSERNEYVVVDPGGVATIKDHVGFPMEMALQALRVHEAAAATLLLFEKLVRAGRYEREFPKILLERSALNGRHPDPLWTMAYILWARENHHFSPAIWPERFLEKYGATHPAILVSAQVPWQNLPPAEKIIAEQWMDAERSLWIPSFRGPNVMPEVIPYTRLFAFHPWQDDLRFARLTFQELRHSHRQEALDILSHSQRTHLIQALMPFSCGNEVVGY